jgi:beta-phosphoglucomutase family hydrolase
VTTALSLAPGLALIFDLDGVVVDSMPIHQAAWRRYLESQGVPPGDLASRMLGRRNDEIVMDFLGHSADAQIVAEHGAAKERLYREMMRESLTAQLVPGVTAFLESARGLPLAVASNAERANIDFVLDGAGLRDYFQAIVDGSQVARSKPAPDIYIRAASELGLAPPDCIVFEDSPVGIEAARESGARVVGIQTHSDKLEDVMFQARDFTSPGLLAWLCEQLPLEPA